jgi:hypothetical protein
VAIHVDEFKKANPDVDVKVSFVEEEAYKVQLPGWLSTQAPDIINWHNGERMAFYASRGLLEDLSETGRRMAGMHLRLHQGSLVLAGQAVFGTDRVLLVGHVLSQGPVQEGRHRRRAQELG